MSFQRESAYNPLVKSQILLVAKHTRPEIELKSGDMLIWHYSFSTFQSNVIGLQMQWVLLFGQSFAFVWFTWSQLAHWWTYNSKECIRLTYTLSVLIFKTAILNITFRSLVTVVLYVTLVYRASHVLKEKFGIHLSVLEYKDSAMSYELEYMVSAF